MSLWDMPAVLGGIIIAVCVLFLTWRLQLRLLILVFLTILPAIVSLLDDMIAWVILTYLRIGDYIWYRLFANDPEVKGRRALRKLSRQSRRKWPLYYV